MPLWLPIVIADATANLCKRTAFASAQRRQGVCHAAIFFGRQRRRVIDGLHDVPSGREVSQLLWNVSAVPVQDMCAGHAER